MDGGNWGNTFGIGCIRTGKPFDKLLTTHYKKEWTIIITLG
jgi:hypothetical protein